MCFPRVLPLVVKSFCAKFWSLSVELFLIVFISNMRRNSIYCFGSHMRPFNFVSFPSSTACNFLQLVNASFHIFNANFLLLTQNRQLFLQINTFPVLGLHICCQPRYKCINFTETSGGFYYFPGTQKTTCLKFPQNTRETFLHVVQVAPS